MKRFDTLYLRLAVVLVVALAAGFATMGYVFHNHVEHNRVAGPGHGLYQQVLLVEALLRSNPRADITAISGQPLYRGPIPPDSEPLRAEDRENTPATRLASELGRPVEVRRGAVELGIWLRLNLANATWIFLAPPGRPRGIEPWAWGLMVSFAIVMVGGMVMLWRVQVPLRKLQRALRQMTPGSAPQPLALAGPREVENLAEQFNQMLSRLHQDEEDRAVMLAGVAHDLRAPITRLRLQLEVDPLPHVKEAMLRNLDSVERIVDQFLLFARGGVAEPLAEYDLEAFIAEVVAPYEEQGVLLRLIDVNGMTAHIRPASLRRGLCNLIENGLEYGQAPVTVSLLARDGWVVFRVEDAGPGIPPGLRAAALRPFTRLDESRSNHGHSGLGLAIAARIAESHGGQLTLGTAAGGGLCADLSLPATIAVADAAESAPSLPQM